MAEQQTLRRYVTTNDGKLYNGTLKSEFVDGVRVWDCASLGAGKHVGFVGQAESGLTSNLCASCDAAREQIIAMAAQKQK